MSANTSIKEGGKGRSFGPVKALMVQGSDGKYYPWYPESERQLDTLSVDKNGIYQASKYGVYGWNRVSVNVPQNEGVTGKDPDTGEEVYVHPDPEGKLVKDVLPVEIRVTTPPTKTAYTDGDTIDYSGIVVHAYSSTGQDLGAVPFSELVFPVSTANAQQADIWTDGAGINALLLQYIKESCRYENSSGKIVLVNTVYVHIPAISTWYGLPATFGQSNEAGSLFITKYNTRLYVASQFDDVDVCLYTYNNGTETSAGNKIFGWDQTQADGSKAHPNAFSRLKTYEYLIYDMPDVPSSTVDPTTVDPTNLRATQSLPVQWHRAPDGAVLETTFTINVTGGV